MDAWCLRHTGKTYDDDGTWAESGEVIDALLEKLLMLPSFIARPPKAREENYLIFRVGGKLPGRE